MGTHLYVCDEGGPMVLRVDGTPPQWATCPLCTKALECSKCEGAQLQGDAPAFGGGSPMLYRCPAGHSRTITMGPAAKDADPALAVLPESACCPECGGLLLPAPVALAVAAQRS